MNVNFILVPVKLTLKKIYLRCLQLETLLKLESCRIN
jgi:hypothetical protein